MTVPVFVQGLVEDYSVFVRFSIRFRTIIITYWEYYILCHFSKQGSLKEKQAGAELGQAQLKASLQ